MNSDYREASFGGAVFYVSQSTDAFGRRGAHHEFPYKDRGLWDDLGGKDGSRQIEGYVTGFLSGGYAAARDRLMEALQKGEGELVHPWLGRHQVVCTDYSVSHNEKELGLDRYRPLIVRPETQVTTEDAEQRAKWEASTRAARGVTASVSVAGWRQNSGELWRPGLLVFCDLGFLHLSRDLMIAKVTFSLDMNGGTVTRLELKDPEAFDKEGPKKASGGKGGGKGGGELQQEAAENGWSAHKELTGGS